jgi:hypothetical protein
MNQVAGLPELSIPIRKCARDAPADWQHVLRVAEICEEVGDDRVLGGDHVVFG